MKTYAHVDWLSATFPADHPLKYLIPEQVGAETFTKSGSGMYGYAQSIRSENGALLLRDGSAKQGQHLILTGDALLAARAEGLSDKALAEFVLDRGGKTTRLDIAVNVLDADLTVEMLQVAYSAGLAETNAKSAHQVRAINAANNTLYIGSRSSYRFFRAYDKGAQVHSEAPWLRLELELKKLYAAAMVNAAAAERDTRPLWNSAIRAYVDFPTLQAYQDALSDSQAVLPHIPRKMTDTYRWLMEQVAPALARYQFDHPNDQIEQAFLTAWHTALDRLTLYARRTDFKIR